MSTVVLAAPAATVPSCPPSPRLRRRRVACLAFGVSGLAFGTVQWLAIAANNHRLLRFYVSSGGYVPAMPVWSPVVYGLGRWAALAVATLVLVRRNPRWAPVPALCVVFLPWLVAGQYLGRQPGAVGDWGRHTPGSFWLGAIVDACLVLVPAGASYLSDRPPRRAWRRPDAVGLAALASSVGLVWLAFYDRDLVVGIGAAASDLPAAATLFVISAAARVRRRTDLIAYGALLIVFPTMIQLMALEGMRPDWTNDIVPAWPFVLAVVAGLSWAPFARLLHYLERSPGMILPVTVNVLNVADAILTVHAVGHVGAVEANGIVKLIGLPAKIVVVAVATVLLSRTHKRALVWPALALAAVLSWHVGGLLVGH